MGENRPRTIREQAESDQDVLSRRGMMTQEPCKLTRKELAERWLSKDTRPRKGYWWQIARPTFWVMFSIAFGVRALVGEVLTRFAIALFCVGMRLVKGRDRKYRNRRELVTVIGTWGISAVQQIAQYHRFLLQGAVLPVTGLPQEMVPNDGETRVQTQASVGTPTWMSGEGMESLLRFCADALADGRLKVPSDPEYASKRRQTA